PLRPRLRPVPGAGRCQRTALPGGAPAAPALRHAGPLPPAPAPRPARPLEAAPGPGRRRPPRPAIDRGGGRLRLVEDGRLRPVRPALRLDLPEPGADLRLVGR